MHPARAGRYVKQLEGYEAFIPNPLPPNPPIKMDSEMIDLLSRADRCLGRLDGATEILPNPDIFVAMYVRKEAVLSSQIEGTQVSLVDVLKYESESKPRTLPDDVGEVVNHVRAMNHGLDRLNTLPVSLRLIREIHNELLRDVRDSEKDPGHFRRSQNWVGPQGCSLKDATYIPPPVHEMKVAMGDLENYLHSSSSVPVLVNCGLVHCQFETIHPFLDGNGRIGRLLITFLLCQREILKRPLLYLSYYFKKHRSEYYNHLMEVRETGDWEGWLKFFLKGIAETSLLATEAARRIIDLQAEHRNLVHQKSGGSPNTLPLLDKLYDRPVISVKDIERMINVTYPTANVLTKKFVDLGLLVEMTGKERNRMYAYKSFLDILNEGIAEGSDH